MTNRRLVLCWVCAHEFHKIESQTSSSLLSCEGDYEENRQDVRPDAGRGPALNPNRPEDRYWLQESLVLALFALWHLLLFFAFALTTRITTLEPFWFSLGKGKEMKNISFSFQLMIAFRIDSEISFLFSLLSSLLFVSFACLTTF